MASSGVRAAGQVSEHVARPKAEVRRRPTPGAPPVTMQRLHPTPRPTKVDVVTPTSGTHAASRARSPSAAPQLPLLPPSPVPVAGNQRIVYRIASWAHATNDAEWNNVMGREREGYTYLAFAAPIFEESTKSTRRKIMELKESNRDTHPSRPATPDESCLRNEGRVWHHEDEHSVLPQGLHAAGVLAGTPTPFLPVRGSTPQTNQAYPAADMIRIRGLEALPSAQAKWGLVADGENWFHHPCTHRLMSGTDHAPSPTAIHRAATESGRAGGRRSRAEKQKEQTGARGAVQGSTRDDVSYFGAALHLGENRVWSSILAAGSKEPRQGEKRENATEKRGRYSAHPWCPRMLTWQSHDASCPRYGCDRVTRRVENGKGSMISKKTIAGVRKPRCSPDTARRACSRHTDVACARRFAPARWVAARGRPAGGLTMQRKAPEEESDWERETGSREAAMAQEEAKAR
ncbi:hypothetical protein B0H11DRAFT_2190570 [Mycena galericulata]|nr:hypothetical protein B0H11DRAFT_2190570 [Mycena galericulata]